jgi:hypothetical protein
VIKFPIVLFPPASSQTQDQGDLTFVALMLGTTFLKLGGILKKAREKVTFNLYYHQTYALGIML